MNNSIKDYWGNVRFDRTLAPHEKAIFPQFVQMASNAKEILEVGVGTGRMVGLLRDAGCKARFSAIDLCDRGAIDGVDLRIGDARQLPFEDNRFDFSYSLGVIEHFPESRQAVMEHMRVTRPGGHVLITTPHVSLYTLKRWLDYLSKNEWKSGSFEVVRGRNLKLGDVINWFSESGLEIARAEGIGNWAKGLAPWEKLDQMFGPYLCVIGRKPVQSK